MFAIPGKVWIPLFAVLAAIVFISSSATDVQAGSDVFRNLRETPDPIQANPSPILSGDLSDVGYWPMGPCYAMDSNGSDRLYAGNGRRLDIYDITTGSSPSLMGSMVVPGFVTAIAADGATLFVGTWRGLVIVDISNPAAPVQLDYLLENQTIGGVFAETDAVYASSSAGMVYKFARSGDSLALDVSVDHGGNYHDIIHRDGHVIVARLDGLAILLEDEALLLVDELEDIPGVLFLKLEGNILYTSAATLGLIALDVTDITAPVLMSDCPFDGSGGDVVISGNYAYHCLMSGMVIVDITDPLNFACGTVSDVGGDFLFALSVGDFIYAGTNSKGLQTYNISNPTAPLLVDAQQAHSYSAFLAWAGDYLLVAQSYSGIKTLDLSDPVQPVQVAAFTLENSNIISISLMGNSAFATTQYNPGFISLNATDPTALATQDTLVMDGATYHITADNTAYISNYAEGLFIVDASDPTNLLRLGHLPDCAPFGMVKNGDYIYTAELGAGMKVIDVSDPANPTIVGSGAGIVDQPYAVCMVPPYLYAGDYGVGGIIIDITTDPENPTLVDTFGDLGIDVLHYADGYLYTHTDGGNYSLWDASDPANPVLLGETPGTGIYGMDVKTRSNLIYGSDYESGMVVMRNANMVPVYMPTASACWQGLEVQVGWQVHHQQPGSEFFVWRENAGSARVPVSGALTSEDGQFTFLDSGIDVTNTGACYWLQERESDGGEFWFGPLELTGVPQVPALAILGPNSPNPFNPSTRIDFTLPRAEEATVKVYDLTGRLVAILFEGQGEIGQNHVIWDGTNDGVAMPSGVYLVRLVTESTTASRKIVLAK